MTFNRHSIRAKIDADSDYFLKQYKGLSIKYEEETAHQIFLDLAAIIDTDNDGLITEKDFDEAADMIRIAKVAKQNNSAELNYKHLPKAVSDVLAQWDADKSGSVGISELVKAGEAQKKMENENHLIKRLLVGAILTILILMAATFGLSFTAVELAKDSRPDESGVQRIAGGTPVQTSVAIEVKKLSEWPSLPFQQLANAQDFNLVFDNEAHHFKVAKIKQNEAKDVTIKTMDGTTVEIASGGVISVDGVVKDVSDGRRLSAVARRLWGGSLMTSGSFTMMASAGGA